MNTCTCIIIGLLVLFIVEVRSSSSIRNLLSNDFESGTMSPWFDQSSARVNWKIEHFDSPAEINSPAPRPPIGTQYLRATRNVDFNSGLVVLRSPLFTALPGDQVQFNFWIRSRQPQANNLELYWTEGNKEHLLISLSQYSSSANFEWRTASVTLPFSTSTETSLIFYGFCGRNEEDAVALDAIVIKSETMASTTNTPTSTITRPSCYVELDSPSGTFTSPKYPNNYDSNVECVWLIATKVNSRIAVTFSAFYTQPDNDVVKIYDGSSSSDPLLLSHSGTSNPLWIESTANVLLITFTSDSSVNYVGFMGHYESIF